MNINKKLLAPMLLMAFASYDSFAGTNCFRTVNPASDGENIIIGLGCKIVPGVNSPLPTSPLVAEAKQCLVKGDWKAEGDELLVVDICEGNQWLSLTATNNTPLSSVASRVAAGDLTEFRFASTSDLNTLTGNTLGVTISSKMDNTNAEAFAEQKEKFDFFVSMFGLPSGLNNKSAGFSVDELTSSAITFRVNSPINEESVDNGALLLTNSTTTLFAKENSSYDNLAQPDLITGGSNLPPMAGISCGDNSCSGTSSSGELWVSGSNNNGQYGSGYGNSGDGTWKGTGITGVKEATSVGDKTYYLDNSGTLWGLGGSGGSWSSIGSGISNSYIGGFGNYVNIGGSLHYHNGTSYVPAGLDNVTNVRVSEGAIFVQTPTGIYAMGNNSNGLIYGESNGNVSNWVRIDGHLTGVTSFDLIGGILIISSNEGVSVYGSDFNTFTGLASPASGYHLFSDLKNVSDVFLTYKGLIFVSNGKAYALGTNYDNSGGSPSGYWLGLGDSVQSTDTPIALGLSGLDDVISTPEGTMLLKDDGTVLYSGSSEDGTMGLGANNGLAADDASAPVFNDTDSVKSLIAGESSSLPQESLPTPEDWNNLLSQDPNFATLGDISNWESQDVAIDLSGKSLTDLDLPASSLGISSLYSLILNNNYITNINFLLGVINIRGTLSIINNINLINIDGLSNLTNVSGDLLVSGSPDLISIESLGNLSTVGGNFDFSNNNLANLNGLGSLGSVGGNFNVSGNRNLSSLAGASSLGSIGGNANFSNGGFSTLNGLSSLRNVGGNFDVSSNPQLTDISALKDLDVVTGEMAFDSPEQYTTKVPSESPFCQALLNDSIAAKANGEPLHYVDLCDGSDIVWIEFFLISGLLGDFSTLDEIETTTDPVSIEAVQNSDLPSSALPITTIYYLIINNNYITNLWFIELLEIIRHNLTITNNINLINLNKLSNLREIQGDFDVSNNALLTSFSGLSNLGTVSGGFNGGFNDNLISPEGLSSLSSVGGNFNLNDNSSMSSLNGLGGFSSFGTGARFDNNPSLTDITAIGNVGSVTSPAGKIMFDHPSQYTNKPLHSTTFCQALLAGEVRAFMGSTQLFYKDLCDVSGDHLGWLQTMGLNIDNLSDLETQDDIINIESQGLSNDDLPSGPLGVESIYSMIIKDNYFVNLIFLDGVKLFRSSLDISQNNINSLAKLLSLISVNGNFNLSSNDITSLDGLDSLTTVGGNLLLNNNPSLADISKLNKIGTVGGYVYLDNPSQYTVLPSMGNAFCDNLASGSIRAYIAGPNTPLTKADLCEGGNEVSALDAFQAMGFFTSQPITDWNTQNITINKAYANYIQSDMPSETLGSVGVTSIYSLGFNNNRITSLKFLGGVTEVRKDLLLNNNDLDNYEGLEGIIDVSGTIRLGYNPKITSFDGLNSLTTVGRLYGFNHSNLRDISALSNLTTVQYNLSLSNNPALESLNGLQSLTKGGILFEVQGNPSLTDISALRNLTTVTNGLRLDDPSQYSVKPALGTPFCEAVGNGTLKVTGGGFALGTADICQ